MRTLMMGMAAIGLSVPAAPALAQPYQHDHGRGHAYGHYKHGNEYRPERYYRPGHAETRVTRNTRIYRGHDGRYYCKHSDGTTGLIIGAAAGGVLGNVLGKGDSKLLTTVIGGAAGGLLGREIDRGNVKCR